MIILYRKFGDVAVLYCSRHLKLIFILTPMSYSPSYYYNSTASVFFPFYIIYATQIRTYLCICLSFLIYQTCISNLNSSCPCRYTWAAEGQQCQEWQETLRHLYVLQVLTSKYSSTPYFDPSLPRPDCLTPPNGATWKVGWNNIDIKGHIASKRQLHAIFFLFFFFYYYFLPLLRSAPHSHRLSHIQVPQKHATNEVYSLWICTQPSLQVKNYKVMPNRSNIYN